MRFFGRTPELGRLRSALDARTASVVRVCGVRGGGKTALVRRALADYEHVVHPARPLPDPLQREELMARITSVRAERGRAPHLEERAPPWPQLLSGLLDLAASGGRPLVLVLDDVHRLQEARSRYLGGVASLVASARADRRPLHVVLVGPEPAMPADEGLPEGVTPPIRVGPLPLRAARRLLPGTRPLDVVRAYAVFGGLPRVLTALDPDAALGTNLRRLVLAPGGPLADAGGEWLERDVQTPARYYAILAALAEGEADWSRVHAGVPDLTRSGQVAPYLRRLEELGLVTARRSLDAGPRTRARRYALADSFFASWARFVLMSPEAFERVPGADAYTELVRPVLGRHIASVFSLVCRQHMELDALETIGETARESGSLWGPGYDLPVAGILNYGSAYYGTCLWSNPHRDDAPLAALDRQIRETRYGFGRERRLRIVFTGHDAPLWLQREIARRHDAHLVDASALVGA